MVFESGSTLKRCVNRALNTLWSNGTMAKIKARWLSQAAGAPVIR
jgi:ABC-type amino acid transport substrate-binding protein